MNHLVTVKGFREKNKMAESDSDDSELADLELENPARFLGTRFLLLLGFFSWKFRCKSRFLKFHGNLHVFAWNLEA